MNNLNVPQFALNCIGVGSGFFLICIGFNTAKSGNVTIEALDVKLKATRSLNEARKVNEDTEQLVKQLKQREDAYTELKQQFDKLSSRYDEVKLLEPQIDKIKALDTNQLETIEAELEVTNKELSEEINQITDE